MRIKEKRMQSKTNSKKLCFCLLLVFFILLLPNRNWLDAYGAQVSPFPDVRLGDWFGEAILRAEDEGILQGYPDGSFRPNATVTYGEFLRMAVKNAPTKGQGHWADGYYEEGICRGLFTDEEILKGALDKQISRKYMALVFAGLLEESSAIAINSTEKEAESESMSPYNFGDIDSRSAFKPFIEQSAMVGILAGYPDHTFRPENFLTRAEAAVAFVRLSDVIAAASTQPGGGENGEATVENSEEASISIEDVMDPEYKAYLDTILESLRVSGSEGNYKYSFEIPEVPGKSDVFFKVILVDFEVEATFNLLG
jgi:hypothetical protein